MPSFGNKRAKSLESVFPWRWKGYILWFSFHVVWHITVYSKKSQKKQISVWEWIKNWNHRILSGWNLIFAYFIFLFFTMQFRYQQRFEDDNNTFVVMEYMENGMLLFISTSIINFWINKQVHFRISWICVRSWVLKFLRRYLFLWYFFRTICYSFYFVCFIL
jgi:hypothetical protein